MTGKRAVCIVRVRNNKFYPIIEIHDNCDGGKDHSKCSLNCEYEYGDNDGFSTRREAEDILVDTAKMLSSSFGNGQLNFYDS